MLLRKRGNNDEYVPAIHPSIDIHTIVLRERYFSEPLHAGIFFVPRRPSIRKQGKGATDCLVSVAF